MKNKIKKVLLDLDGTMFDTQTFHAQAEAALIKEKGVVISPEEISRKYAGRPTEVVFKESLGCTDEQAAEFSVRKWQKVFPRASDARQLFDIGSFLLALQSKKIAFSIGTASPTKWARDILIANGLNDFFGGDSIIGGDNVSKGKPDPEIWIKAAGGTSPNECLVVEDGIAGVQAALTAGMHCALILPRKYHGAYEIKCASDVLDLL